jgi:Zn ribbon nucleic-acid-binding protein
MKRESVTLICPTCHKPFNVLEDEAIKGMECLQCGYLSENEGESKMDKEKVLRLISEAIDKGASIGVYVGQYDKGNEWVNHNEEEAQNYIVEFSKAIGGGEVKHEPSEIADSFVVSHNNFYVSFSYLPLMEEDVKFHEEGDAESA